MDLATHQAQANNDTRPDTTPESRRTTEAIHARLGRTPEANLQDQETTPDANLQDQEGQSRMANALDKRSDECRRTIEEIKADLDKNLARRAKYDPLLSDSGKSKILNELLFSPWDDKQHALGAVHFWVAQNASVCGTG